MKGICTNLDCQNNYTVSKVVIDIPDGEEFKCPKCGSRLIEYKKAVPWYKRNNILIICAALVIIVGVVLLLTIPTKTVTETPEVTIVSEPTPVLTETIPNPDSSNPELTPTPGTENPETTLGEQPASETEVSPSACDTIYDIKPVPVVITNVIKYSFGEYHGDIKNGIPEGHGIMYYNCHVQIAKHDTKKPPHYAEEGDYFDGEWANGDILSGALYDKNKELKEKIYAPKRPNPYDLNKD